MKKLFILAITLMMMLMGCSDEAEQPKSIQDIQAAQGIPVSIEKVESVKLEQWEEFQTTLEGAKEANVFGLLNDNLESVTVKLGDYVEEGDIVAEYATDSPTAQYTQALLAKQNAEKLFNRMQVVYNAGGISKQELDNIQTQYDVSVENLNSVSKLVRVEAPIAGRVTEINYDPGDFCSPATPIVRIVNTRTLRATIDVDETRINRFKKHQTVMISWDAVPNKEFRGTITGIALSANPKKRGFAVDIKVNNASDQLRAGAFVTASINTNTTPDAVVVNRLSVINENEKDYIFVIEDNKAEKREVKTGIVVSDKIEITSGLTTNENYVFEGQSRLQNGSKVNIITSNDS